MESDEITLKPIPPEILLCSVCKKNISIHIEIQMVNFINPVMNAGINQESRGENVEVIINN